jgi:hypothetical protein
MAYKLGFKKYKAKTLEWLFFHDLDYVWWMLRKGDDIDIARHRIQAKNDMRP